LEGIGQNAEQTQYFEQRTLGPQTKSCMDSCRVQPRPIPTLSKAIKDNRLWPQPWCHILVNWTKQCSMFMRT